MVKLNIINRSLLTSPLLSTFPMVGVIAGSGVLLSIVNDTNTGLAEDRITPTMEIVSPTSL